MHIVEYKTSIGKYRSQTLKLLNDTFIWSQVVLNSLIKSEENPEIIFSQKFLVPSKKEGKKIRRDSIEVRRTIREAHEQHFLFSIFTYIIAQFEGFLYDLVKTCLLYDNRKLKINVQGINHIKNLDVNAIIDSESRESLINLIIQKELASVFYASPNKQKEYLQKVTGIEIDQTLWSGWIEYKATKDLIVHNQGVVNEIYIEKTGDLARVGVGDTISVDLEYFKETIANLKSLVGRITNKIQKDIKTAGKN